MDLQQTIEKYKLRHLAGWLLLFAVWYFLRYQDFSTTKLALGITAIKVVDLAILVYITNYVLIPRLLYKRKYAFFALLYVTMIFCSSILKIFIVGNILNPSGGFSVWDNFKTRFYDNVIPHFLLVSTGAAIKLMKDYIQSQKRLSQVSLEKAETELKFLKSQINPHFVFNTLNTIYFQIEKTNTIARESLLQFSDLLRYQLYDCNADTIEIEKEMQYLRDFVQLQQKRKDENYSITMNGSMNVNGFRITPLLLLPLVENAFKHISHFNEKENIIRIHAEKDGADFIFKVENTKESAHVSTEKKSGGIGLQNMQRRLELLYPQQHSLEIKDSGGWFIVLLKLAIK